MEPAGAKRRGLGGAVPAERGTGGTWQFLGAPPQEDFTSSHTAAEVTGTVADGQLGICYQPAVAPGPTEVSQIP